MGPEWIIEHVGSTSVPGLLAKPVIDVALQLPAGHELARWEPIFQGLGWTSPRAWRPLGGLPPRWRGETGDRPHLHRRAVAGRPFASSLNGCGRTIQIATSTRASRAGTWSAERGEATTPEPRPRSFWTL
ncbi:MAG: GrpB family protein [Actinopolymorphaceae bacterium]